MTASARVDGPSGPPTQADAGQASDSSPISFLVRPLMAVTRVVLIVSAVAQVLLVLAAIIGRFFFTYSPPAWEELAGYLFLWNVMLGTSLTIEDDSMPMVRLLESRLPGQRDGIAVLRYLVMLTLFVMTAIGGWQLIPQSEVISTPDLPISQAWPFSVILIASVVAGVVCLSKLLAALRRTRVVAMWAGLYAVLVVIAVVVNTTGLVGAGLGAVYGLVAVLVVTIALTVPIGVALTLSALMAAAWSHTTPMVAIAVNLAASLNNFILLAIPFFLLTGIILARSSLSGRLLGLARSVFGGRRGAVGISDVVASVLFADMSGSAIADTAALGAVVIPELKRAGYPAERAVALQASAGALGIMFPPSVTMIIYASVANVSVIQAFLSVVIPGAILAAVFAVMTYLYARRKRLDAGVGSGGRERLQLAGRGLLVFLIPVVLLGGILSGLASPAEAGTLAVVVALVLAVAVYRDLRLRDLPGVILEATRIIARVGFVIASATVVGFVLTSYGGPQALLSALQPLSSDVVLTLVLFALALLLIHTMMDATATMLVVTPLLEPVLSALHVSLIRFGVLIDVTSAAGLIIPPIGFNLYIACQTGGVSLERATRAVVPFVLATLGVTLVIILVPWLSTYLPGLVH